MRDDLYGQRRTREASKLIAETWASSGATAPKQLVVMLFLAANADHDDVATIDVKPDAARCRLTPSDFVWTLTDLVSAGESPVPKARRIATTCTRAGGSDRHARHGSVNASERGRLERRRDQLYLAGDDMWQAEAGLDYRLEAH